jgi:CheY-like chemotaxis protein
MTPLIDSARTRNRKERMTTKTYLDLLIVEDEGDTRLLLTQIFTLRGFTVRSAGDGFAALQMIRSSAPDILLSDLNMPGMSGFELLSVVRRLYPQIHVIATSGAYSGTTVPKGIAADGFHEKASGMATLFELMDIAAQLGHTSLYSERTPTPLWIDLECRMPFDTDHVLINCPLCLRPFRQTIDSINAEIRETNCRYCGGKVDYAIALAIQPRAIPSEPRPLAIDPRPAATEPKPAASELRGASAEYSTASRNVRRA